MTPKDKPINMNLSLIRLLRWSTLIAILFIFNGCYSLKGIAIDPETNTFYVATFENTSNNVVPNLDQDFTEALREKIRDNSRLRFTDIEPDIEFSGAITSYRITAQAPEAGETVSFNRLTINVSVDYVNNKKDDDKWTKTFSFFENFEASQNVLDIQDDLIQSINTELVERIFNDAFTSW